jgi:hypothetical protein
VFVDNGTQWLQEESHIMNVQLTDDPNSNADPGVGRRGFGRRSSAEKEDPKWEAYKGFLSGELCARRMQSCVWIGPVVEDDELLLRVEKFD